VTMMRARRTTLLTDYSKGYNFAGVSGFPVGETQHRPELASLGIFRVCRTLLLSANEAYDG